MQHVQYIIHIRTFFHVTPVLVGNTVLFEIRENVIHFDTQLDRKLEYFDSVIQSFPWIKGRTSGMTDRFCVGVLLRQQSKLSVGSSSKRD